MKGRLVGTNELKARLREMGQAFKPMGKDWASDTAERSNRTSPRGVTGDLSRSHKVKSATARRATVVAIFYAKFVNRGTSPHAIKAKGSSPLIFDVGGRTIFAKAVNHRGMRGTRYVDKAAVAAAHEHLNKEALIDAWNRGA